MHVDVSFLPAYGAAFILVFARIGTMLMLLPGLGEASLSARMRLSVAVVLTAILFPLHRAAYQLDLRAFWPTLTTLGEELLVGAVLGFTARLTISALEVAGSVMALQLGLANITGVDPSEGQQGMLLGNFLTMLGITLIFATDMHHLVIAALNDSYTLFAPGELPPLGDAAAHLTRTVAAAFRIGIQVSAPFLAFGLMFNVGLAVLSRLIPQMQVFFVGAPLSIMLGLVTLAFVVGTMMTIFLGHVGGVLHDLAPHY